MWLLLPAISCGFALGVVLGWDATPRDGLSFLVVGCAWTLLVAAGKPRWLVVPAAFVASVAAGAWRAALVDVAGAALPEGEVAWIVQVEGARPGVGPATVTGRVRAWSPERPPTPSVWHASLSGRRVVLTHLEARAPLRCGDVILVRGVARAPGPPLHEFAFDPSAWARRQRIAGWVRPAGEPVVIAQRATPCGSIDAARIGMEHALLEVARPESAGVLLAMTTGTQTALDPEVRARFAANGAAHVLAVSGMHLNLLCAALYAVLERWLRRWAWVTTRWGARRAAASAAIPAVIAYVILTGAPASAVRSGVMCVAMLASVGLNRPASAVHALCLSVFVMLAARPAWVADIGFQLSVAATAALVVASLGRRRPEAEAVRPRGRRARAARAIWESVVVSLVATGATAPVLLYHFGSIPVASPLTNLVVVPLLSVVALPASFVGSILHWRGVPGGAPLIELAGAATLVSLRLAEGLGPLLELSLVWGRPAPAALVGWSVVALVSPLIGRLSGRARLAVGAVVVGLLATDPPPWLRPPRETVLHAIPVGQGDCTLIELPSGYTMLIDAGGAPSAARSVGLTAALPYLRGIGIDRVDAIVATHSDFDHAGGLVDLIGPLRPRDIFVPASPPAPIFDAMQAEASRVGAAWHALVLPAARVDPDGPVWVLLPSPLSGSTNERSLVLRLCHDAVCALLTGDIEHERERALIRSGVPLEATYLKAPHHGSPTSSTAELLARVAPRVVVIHLGRDNRYGFPSPDVLARYAAGGAYVQRTDGGAALRFHTDGRTAWLR